MLKRITLLALWVFLAGGVFAQTQNDTIFNYRTATPVVVDGEATEACWAEAEWHAIDQVWIPYNATMAAGDFEGRFKVAWDVNYLYLLVEVVDDMLSDDHSNPMDSWWDDDCVEVFIDENRSKGDHTYSCNAFAYHVSLTYDALDMNASGGGVNYKNNMEVLRKSLGNNTYLWEFAFKNYSAAFSLANPEASRVYLTEDKLMGFAIAYCDNDQTTSRENFIGSMIMTQANANKMYQNADYFGPMKLVVAEPTKVDARKMEVGVKVFPVPARQEVTIQTGWSEDARTQVFISTAEGRLVKQAVFYGRSYTISLEGLEPGAYLLNMRGSEGRYSQLIQKR